jgi:hypothetical protein
MTLRVPTTVPVNTSFAVVGALAGYTVVPHLTTSRDLIVPPPTKLTAKSAFPRRMTVSWAAPPAMWLPVPGSSVTRTSFHFMQTPITTAGNHLLAVTDGTHTPIARFTVTPPKPTVESVTNQLQLTHAAVTDAQAALSAADATTAQASMAETLERLTQLLADVQLLGGQTTKNRSRR